MNKRQLYWLCQIGGWLFYGLIQVFLYSTANTMEYVQVLGEVVFVLFNIGATHIIRKTLIGNGWLSLGIAKLIPRVLILILAFSLMNYGVLIAFLYIIGDLTPRDFGLPLVMLNILGPMIIYSIWTMLYLTFHYFENYNKSLKYEAAAREIELKNLRSQLNPHFIFNALNSIRALVDENPDKSKEAITQLSNILRNSLMVDRQRLISFTEEMITVVDYLALESIRYEERLTTVFDIDDRSGNFLIPPLMIQTLVENGIKHGISNLKDGGEISIVTEVMGDDMRIFIRNSGQLNEEKPTVHKNRHGFGLANTKKRLELIYGNSATFSIVNENQNTVLTEINIPRTL